MNAVIVCPTCDGHPKRLNLRVEGGSLSCKFCNRTLTFNFMRDQEEGVDRRCSCRASREAECPTCLGEATIPAPTPSAPPTAGEVPEELRAARALLAWVNGVVDIAALAAKVRDDSHSRYPCTTLTDVEITEVLAAALTPEATGEPT